MVFLLTGISIFLVGISATVYQLFKLVETDAITRNIKKPKFFAFLATGGKAGEGILAYLIYRRKFKVVNITEEQKIEMNRRKKILKFSISFMALGKILMIIYFLQI